MPGIERVTAREVFDSRGEPAIEVEVRTDTGARGWSIAPSGGSVGIHEARELRDADRPRFGGRGVRRAVGLVASTVEPALRGTDVVDQPGIDARLIDLDGTADRSRLGVNTLAAASVAAARAAASARDEPPFAYFHGLWRAKLAPEPVDPMTLPMPMVHMICGRSRAGRALDFQDVLALPVAARDFAEAVAMVAAVYRSLGEILHRHGHPTHLVGCHGGYGPPFWSSAQAVDLLLEAVAAAGLRVDRDVAVALDVAASQVHVPGSADYRLQSDREPLDDDGMIAMLDHWTRQYPITSIEDGLGEDDWPGWSRMTGAMGGKTQLVGDDLFASQAGRLREGIDRGAANAIAVKISQVGTLSETLDTLALARRHGRRRVIAARSGDSEDTTMADLAVATAADQVKIGALCRSERTAKYNRLLRIESQLGPGSFARWEGSPR